MAYDITANQTSSGINLFYDEMSVSAGGVAENTVVKHGGNLYVYTGGAANNTVMSNGYMEVYSGGSANNTAVSAGYLHIYSSGTAASTTVYGGRMEIHDGGEAVETTVDAGGTLVISKGGTAETLTVNENGKINCRTDDVVYISVRSCGGFHCISARYSNNIHFADCRFASRKLGCRVDRRKS